MNEETNKLLVALLIVCIVALVIIGIILALRPPLPEISWLTTLTSSL